MTLSRRRVWQMAGGAAVVALGGASAIGRWMDPRTPLSYPFPADAGADPDLPATPSCPDSAATSSQIQGPYYTPNTPLRSVLREAGTFGTPLVIEGRVLSSDCRPIAAAVLDVWNCDGNGVYDNDGFKLRGHQFTDHRGAFRIETVKPGEYWYLGFHRTPHVHVKVQGRETRLLTTQLYFPGEPNEKDRFFNESLLLSISEPGSPTLHASFDFVLPRLG